MFRISWVQNFYFKKLCASGQNDTCTGMACLDMLGPTKGPKWRLGLNVIQLLDTYKTLKISAMSFNDKKTNKQKNTNPVKQCT